MKKLYALLLAISLPGLCLAGPVNVNTADAETLSAELDGIGLAKAEAIVRYRAEYGAFETAEELLKVKGIGTRILDANEGNIMVRD